jgi:iron complex outermembrane receptor protein
VGGASAVRASWRVIGVALAGLWPSAAHTQTGLTLPPVDVIATSPLPGPGIDRDKVPGLAVTISADDFARTFSHSVTETLSQRVPGVSLSDVQGNTFVQDFRYRGFAASPLQGTPQGIAVYLNGMRLNEAFGDTVNWDLIPNAAIDRADIWTNNPVFGLNALGGAVSIQLKNGFTFQGREAVLQGGSAGRLSGSLQHGQQNGGFAVYVAAEGLVDAGWRYQSPSRIKRFYGDLGWQGERGEAHLSAGFGSNFFGVVGPTPIDLLKRDYKSIYTWPQTTHNETGFFAFNSRYDMFDHWSVQNKLYIRNFHQRHVDGNDAELDRCSGNPANTLFNTLCLDDGGFPSQPKANFQMLNPSNQPINCPPGPGNTCATTPWGTVDRTATDALTVGGLVQVTSNARLFERDNNFTAGASIDHSWVKFGADSELGTIFPDLSVGPNPAVPGIGVIIHTAGNLGYSPVSLGAQNTYYGLYFRNTFDVTPRLSATVGARLNVARITMWDQLGTSPELNGSYTFTRLNPLAGVTYKVVPDLTAYAAYSEANRAPTPLELGCANPNKPCLLQGFLVSDPPLQQIVSRTYEAGLRGNMPVDAGRIDWKLGLFRTDSINDIINVASAIQGRGVFQNVDITRRQGVEAGAQLRSGQWLVSAGYSFIDATYRFTGRIASPNNPSADADGNVLVVPGKHRVRGDVRLDPRQQRDGRGQPVLRRRRWQPE